jgi:predicted transcriptional regulator
MKISKVIEVLNAKVLTGKNLIDEEVFSACGSDLMSDVLAFVKTQGLLLTGLNNLQVVRTAEMMDIKVIAFVRGKTPDNDIIELAERKDMIILTTDEPLYSACGNLYLEGLGRQEG